MMSPVFALSCHYGPICIQIAVYTSFNEVEATIKQF